MGCVYCLYFPNGKRYVGVTHGTADARFSAHKYTAANGKSHEVKHVHRAIAKYTPERVVLATLVVCGNYELLKRIEVAFISSMNTKSPNGYNLTDGGEGLLAPPACVRAKISAAGIGRKHTEATKLKIKISLTGKPKSKAQVEKMKALPGVPWTEERKAKFSEYRKGKRNNETTLAAMRAAAIKRWAAQKQTKGNL